MKIFAHRYQLFPKAPIGSVASGKPREGALLRFDFLDGSSGYSDCHPWPELGDLPISMQLEKLQKRQWTELTEQSFEFARIDAHARKLGISLFKDAEIPKSHALFLDVQSVEREALEAIAANGFREIKIKVGVQPVREARHLLKIYPDLRRLSLNVRLDFNSSLTSVEFENFLEELGPAREVLDFVEDPTPFDSETWARFQNQWGIRLALDRDSFRVNSPEIKKSVSVLVVKPAVQKIQKVVEISRSWDLPVVVTSYLDHPFGQLCAAWAAFRLLSYGVKVETCGLLSHSAYETNECSALLRADQGHLLMPPGTGFGMDSVLEKINWGEIGGWNHENRLGIERESRASEPANSG